ncbi:MAG: DnaJ family protein C protein 8 [Bacillariaceae sp.]|jgi:DnaJ family protein C protein 8
MSEPSSDTTKEAPTAVDDAPSEALEEWEIQRDSHKKDGDAAFRAGGYRTAIDQYTKAISLDPEFIVLYSNRSAAFLSNGESSKALKDARKCIELDTAFAKGHSRLAAALLALKRFEQAKDSYQHVLEKEPKNAAAKNGIDVCVKEISKRMTLEQQRQKEKEKQEKEQQQQQQQAAGKEEDEEDDLLNDFFNEVEEVVTKKKDTASSQNTNNAIRNDRKTLGTTQEQIDRLIQPRFEWRNLNPFFVLQLPAATATEDDVSRRYKALSLLLHPDKNQAKLSTEEEKDRCQLAYDQVQKAKIILADEDRKRYIQSLVEEGMKLGENKWKKEKKQQQQQHNTKNTIDNGDKSSDVVSLDVIQEREVMRIFAQVEIKRKDVEDRERKFAQRERQQEDDQSKKERNERKFDKKWRNEERVDKRVGNWRDFETNKKKKM